MSSVLTSPSVIAAAVAIAIGGIITAARYVFGVELLTKGQADNRLDGKFDSLETQLGEISTELESHHEQLDEIERLVVGGEYGVNKGMVEAVKQNADDISQNGDRIDELADDIREIRRNQRMKAGEKWGRDYPHADDGAESNGDTDAD